MNPVYNDPNEVIASAIKFEQEGHKILSDAGESARDALSKATFRFLADQELQHIAAIKAFAASMSGEAEFDPALINSPVNKQEAQTQIIGLFKQFEADFRGTAALDEERLGVYDVAMNMERYGHNFYAGAAQSATDEPSRKLYQFLAGEETHHFEIIQETADYLRNPGAFLAVEEGWMTT